MQLTLNSFYVLLRTNLLKMNSKRSKTILKTPSLTLNLRRVTRGRGINDCPHTIREIITLKRIRKRICAGVSPCRFQYTPCNSTASKSLLRNSLFRNNTLSVKNEQIILLLLANEAGMRRLTSRVSRP